MQMEHCFSDDYVQTEDQDCLQISRDVRLSDRTISVSPRSHMENERRLRREIANSNERRRMQSINAGFQSLRTLLPSHEGEKLSKAAILQQTAEYIYTLEQEKTRLLSQNCQLKRLLNQHEGENVAPAVKKRKMDSQSQQAEDGRDGESLIEGETIVDSSRREMMELRMGLERERRLRMDLEEKLHQLESSMYPDNIHLSYESHENMGVMDQTSVKSDVDEMVETVEEMEVPLPLMTDDLDEGDIISSSALPPVVQTQTVTTEVIKCELDDVSEVDGLAVADAAAVAASRLLRRLPSVIEAAIKAEPKVEVERLPTPGSGPIDDPSISNCPTRQSLETIVEAIRHLEGDHLFSDLVSAPLSSPPSPPPPSPSCHRVPPMQDAPLALTTKQQTHRLIKVDINPFLKLHTSQALQHQRPGVIVVKHS